MGWVKFDVTRRLSHPEGLSSRGMYIVYTVEGLWRGPDPALGTPGLPRDTAWPHSDPTSILQCRGHGRASPEVLNPSKNGKGLKRSTNRFFFRIQMTNCNCCMIFISHI